VEFWIDVENATGVKYGEGPITSATVWQHTPRLDGAGEFSFTMPSSDPMSTHLANKRIVRCYGMVNGARTEVGAGIIDKIQAQIGTPTMLQVSGPDIMGELAYRSVGDLVICEQAWVNLNDADTSMVGWYRVDVVYSGDGSGSYDIDENISIPNAHDANASTYESIYLESEISGFPEHAAWLYVGHDARFDRIKITLMAGEVADNDQTLQAQYYNGSGWATLVVTDGTDNSGTFKQDGEITFTRPTDWTRYTAAYGLGDWFWVRMRVARTWPDNPSSTGYFQLAEVTAYADVPTTNGVNLIMAYAPSTWTRTGYPATVSAKYLEFHGESVLEALLTLAEQGGTSGTTAIREHFRLGTGRAISWLGTTLTASGVRCIASEDAIAAEGDTGLAVIYTLMEQKDSADIVTRIYPRTGDAITLSLSTRDAPTGYTHSLANNYIQHTAGNTAYGQIERWMEFSEISMQQTDSYTTHPEYAANQLHDRAVEYLRTHAVLGKFYALSIVQFAQMILPGETVEVVYHEWTDGLHTIDIDTVRDAAPLHVLAPTIQIASDGVATVGLEVATIDRAAQTDAGVVVDLVRRNTRQGYGSLTYYNANSSSIMAALPANQRVYTYAATIGNVTSTSYTVTHNLGVADVVVQVWDLEE